MLKVFAHGSDTFSVVWYLLGTWIALQVEHPQICHSNKDLACNRCCIFMHLSRTSHISDCPASLRKDIRIPDFVVLNIQCRDCSLDQVKKVIDASLCLCTQAAKLQGFWCTQARQSLPNSSSFLLGLKNLSCSSGLLGCSAIASAITLLFLGHARNKLQWNSANVKSFTD